MPSVIWSGYLKREIGTQTYFVPDHGIVNTTTKALTTTTVKPKNTTAVNSNSTLDVNGYKNKYMNTFFGGFLLCVHLFFYLNLDRT